MYAPILLIVVALFVPRTHAAPQSAAKSPEEAAMQREKAKEFFARRDVLRGEAKATLNREMAREKNGDCPQAKSSLDTDMCLAKEIQTTAANYKEYAGNLHSMLGLESPGGDDPRAQGPQEAARQFDEVEKHWQVYETARCSAISNNFVPGTIAPLMGSVCQQRLTRNHMRELDEIYDPVLWH